MVPFCRAVQQLACALLFACVAVVPPLLAQASPGAGGTLAGIVVDAATGAPLSAARVRVVEQPHRVETTHEDGGFSFAGLAAGNYTLAVERLGYGQATRRVGLRTGQTERVRIELSNVAVALNEIVVTGTLGARRGRDALSPTAVVSGAELDRQLEGTVAASVASTPGVTVSSIGPSTAKPVIRGLSGDRVLVLEDGMRPGDLSSTSGDHAVAIEPLTARRFEVVRGPMSLLYGSSALGGVVNVVRDEIPNAVPEHVHGLASVVGSTVDGGASAGAYATAGLGRFALRGEGSVRGAGNIQTPAGELTNTDVQTLNFAASGSYVPEWGHVGAAYRFYDNEYGIPGGFVGAHPNGVDIQMRRHSVRGEAEAHPAGLFSTLRATGGFTDYRHYELEQSGRIGTVFDQEMVVGEVVGRHGAFGVFGEGAVGVRAQYRDIQTGGSLRTPSTYDYTFAGYAVEELGHGPLRVQVGARYDWARYVPREEAFISVGGEQIPVRPRTFGSLSGSLGLLYAIQEDLRIGASLSRAYRTPDFNELYSNGPHLAANSYDVGDPTLGEETGLGADVFARLTRTRFQAEVAAFWNRLDGYIFPSSRGRVERGLQGGRPLFQYTNEDAVFSGFEGDVDWSLTRHVVLDGTFSYVRAEFTSDRAPIPVFSGADTTFVVASEYPPFIPPLNGRLGARYERSNYFVGGAARFAAEQDRLGDFEEATEGYAVTEFNAGLRLARGGRLHTLTLRVDNLFDTEYRDHLSRVKEIMPEPGRNLSLLYRLTF